MLQVCGFDSTYALVVSGVIPSSSTQRRLDTVSVHMTMHWNILTA